MRKVAADAERFKLEYELARKIGDKRFGSVCSHAQVKNGTCQNCLRKVVKRWEQSCADLTQEEWAALPAIVRHKINLLAQRVEQEKAAAVAAAEEAALREAANSRSRTKTAGKS